MSANINSSDIEFSSAPIPEKLKRLGKRSIEEISENQVTDRLQSKRISKQLTFGRGSPSAVEQAYRWVNRFNAFRLMTLKQSVAVPFDGEAIERFLSRVLDNLDSSIPGKHAVTLDTLKTGSTCLLQYGRFQYNLKLSTQEIARISTLFDNLLRQKLLTKGVYQKRSNIGFSILHTMLRRHFDRSPGLETGIVIVVQSLTVSLFRCLFRCFQGDPQSDTT